VRTFWSKVLGGTQEAMNVTTKVLAALAAPVLALAVQPARILIVTGETDEAYHHWRQTVPFFETLLRNTGRFDIRVTQEPRALTREALSGYDAVFLNYNGPRWGSGPESALDEFVRSGKGLVTFHGVTYGPLMGTIQRPGGNGWDVVPGWRAYSDMLGVTWAPENIGHAVRHAFTVKLTDSEHPITRGLTPEFTVNDELYHKMDHKPGKHVLATAFSDPARGGSGKDEPMAWTVPYGKGRVFYCPLGHDTSALYQPEVLALFARATEWAATGEVTLPPTASLVETAPDALRVLVVTGGHDYAPSFYNVFNHQADIRWSHVATQQEAFSAKMKDLWDVVVLYDMYDQVDEPERKNLRDFVESGKGLVALHHSLIDYTAWPWWYEQVTGGKYFVQAQEGHPPSHFKDDVPMVLRPARGMEGHPIVRGLGELVTTDECYSGIWHSPDIKVLMETVNDCNDRPMVWIGPGAASRTVYIQLGHGSYTHNHPGYRTLVHNAILWAAGRTK
jgi:type 1 glutamine amidotransferase